MGFGLFKILPTKRLTMCKQMIDDNLNYSGQHDKKIEIVTRHHTSFLTNLRAMNLKITLLFLAYLAFFATWKSLIFGKNNFSFVFLYI